MIRFAAFTNEIMQTNATKMYKKATKTICKINKKSRKWGGAVNKTENNKVVFKQTLRLGNHTMSRPSAKQI
jgi:hypothetical protein